MITGLAPDTTRPAYGPLVDNPWFSPLDEPLSTFSIDVDTASWTNLRAMIRSGRSADAIPDDAVRIEELINYFEWDYPQPDGEHPFAFATETAECPWNEDHRLMRVGIQGREIPRTDRPDANLVFLLDVSGSMNRPNKLPLVKRSISVLVEELEERDTVSIVVYAGAEGLALRPTSGRDQVTIQNALDNLGAGGSTNGGAGIKLAYKMAREQFVEDGINRVILCTDGDFNVGTTGTDELVSLVEKEAGSGVFLSVCGFGQDNLNDAMLEEITNKGNGNYAYIDDFREARKVFLHDLMGTLMTIAKDVKIQIEFNPAEVDGYRLIGYANRKLEAEDFENDEIDAGEVGSGHAVTALYEIAPAGAKDNPADDEIGLRYQKKDRPAPERELIPSGELALLKLRYKQPDGEQSIPMEQPVMPAGRNWKHASDDFRFASAVGLFGMILRDHESVGDATLDDVIAIASKAKGADPQGWRAEFVDLVKQLNDKEPAPIVPPEIRAVVNGEKISQSMVDDFIRLQVKVWLLEPRGTISKNSAKNYIRQIEKNALEDLIDRNLILGEFDRRGGKIKEQYIDEAVDEFIERHFDGDHEKFEDELRKSDMTVSNFRRFKMENIAVRALKSEHSNPDGNLENPLAEESIGSWMEQLRRDAEVRVFPK